MILDGNENHKNHPIKLKSRTEAGTFIFRNLQIKGALLKQQLWDHLHQSQQPLNKEQCKHEMIKTLMEYMNHYSTLSKEINDKFQPIDSHIRHLLNRDGKIMFDEFERLAIGKEELFDWRIALIREATAYTTSLCHPYEVDPIILDWIGDEREVVSLECMMKIFKWLMVNR